MGAQATVKVEYTVVGVLVQDEEGCGFSDLVRISKAAERDLREEIVPLLFTKAWDLYISFSRCLKSSACT